MDFSSSTPPTTSAPELAELGVARLWLTWSVIPVVLTLVWFVVSRLYHDAELETTARRELLVQIWTTLDRDLRATTNDSSGVKLPTNLEAFLRTEDAKLQGLLKQRGRCLLAVKALNERPVMAGSDLLGKSWSGASDLTFDRSDDLAAYRHTLPQTLSAEPQALVGLINWHQPALLYAAVVGGAIVTPLTTSACGLAVWVLYFYLALRFGMAPVVSRLAHLEQDAALARAAQTLVHDVRKPLSLVRILLKAASRQNADRGGDAVSPVDDQRRDHELRRLVREMAPALKHALAVADGLITDVLEIGSRPPLAVETTSPETLIDQTLTEICQLFPEATLTFDYRLRHRQMLAVDGGRVMRVFLNIVTNAVQAMGGKGELWFITREITENRTDFIEITIGNSGTLIAAADVPHVFDAFFTKGKKQGTGLGLAIAKKVVVAHGGWVRCQSTPGIGTEFIFSLPVAPQSSHHMASGLPASSMALSLTGQGGNSSGPDGARRVAVTRFVTDQDRKLRLLIVEEESVYRNLICSLIAGDLTLARTVQIVQATFAQVAQVAEERPYDLILLGDRITVQGNDQIRVAEQLVQSGYRGLVCLHRASLAVDAARRGQVADAGLQAGPGPWLPKHYPAALAARTLVVQRPVDTTQMLAALSMVAGTRPTKVVNLNRSALTPVAKKRLPEGQTLMPLVAVVDDDPFVREAWRQALHDARCEVFASPQDFWQQAASTAWLESLTLVITDFHFGPESQDDGGTFATALRLRRVVPILLASDLPRGFAPLPPAVTLQISKEPCSLRELQDQLSQSELPVAG